LRFKGGTRSSAGVTPCKKKKKKTKRREYYKIDQTFSVYSNIPLKLKVEDSGTLSLKTETRFKFS